MADPHYPGLETLLSAYLHPDWDLDHPNEASVLRAFEADDPGALGRLRDEFDRLLEAHSDDEELRHHLRRLGGIYLPSGPDGTLRGWLLDLRRRTVTL